jgi:hypothetical protein
MPQSGFSALVEFAQPVMPAPKRVKSANATHGQPRERRRRPGRHATGPLDDPCQLVDMAVQADSNGPQGNHEWWAFYQLLRLDLASEVKGEPLEADSVAVNEALE